MSSTRSEPSWLMDSLRGMLAVATLTVREAMRQRLWLVLVVAVAAVLLAVPLLQAAEESDRLRLSVAVISGTIAFVTSLLAIFMVCVAVRRDLETRCSFMLFSKPLPRLAYCLGRWLGATLSIIVVVSVLTLAGTLAVMLQLGGAPASFAVQGPDQWQRIDRFGALSLVRDDEQRINMPQRTGAGMQVRFTGAQLETDAVLLVKASVRGSMTGAVSVPMQVAVLREDADGRLLPTTLQPSGEGAGLRDRAGRQVESGQVLLRHRDEHRNDLERDYLAFPLQADWLDDDGTLTIRIVRTDDEGAVSWYRDNSLLIRQQGQPFMINLWKASLVAAAQASMLAAIALMCVIFTGVGTTLLASLTVLGAGSTVGVVREVAQSSQTGIMARRLIDLVLPVVPDFSRFPVATLLAQGQTIPFATVLAAWWYFAMWMVVALALAWWILRRREL